MADISPLRGLTYSQERIGSFDNVATQPYDKISPRMREEYLRRSPFNIARIIMSAPEGMDLKSHFSLAAGVFNGWLKNGILQLSERPCLYPYFQTYRVPGGGMEFTRKSFIGL